MQQNKSSFLDSNTLLAVVAVMAILFGWQAYMNKKYPQLNNPIPTETSEVVRETEETTKVAAVPEASAPQADFAEQKFLRYEDDQISFQISNYGMGLHNITIKKFKDREKNQVLFDTASEMGSFETQLLGVDKPLIFEMESTRADQITGTANYGNLKVVKTLNFNRNNYTVDVHLEIFGMERGVSGIETILVDKVNAPESSGWMMPDFDIQSVYVDYGAGKNTERFTLQHLTYDDAVKKYGQNFPDRVGINDEEFKGVAVASLDRHYFTTAVLDKSAIQPEFVSYYTYSSDKSTFHANAVGRLIYRLPAGRDHLEFEYKLFAGPKSYDLLNSIDKRLSYLVDFGYGGLLDWLAYPLFRLMKWLYTIFHNYGFAIIFLTLIVRILVMPFHIMSLRSMKNMQKFQPQMKAIREKFKSDPKQQQAEIMSFMKTHKINPLGGCLPMLLQMPVFFALYRVLYQSIELYQAPFILWIHDLSYKDPYYVLPILMGVTLFIQQKITPNTMDPAQAKMMMIMPFIFSLFMISLPSGLNLYIFVSTLIGIIQHIIFMKDKTVTARQPANARA